MKIADREVGPGMPVCIVAELSANHDQSYERAEEILSAAMESGADAVKIQTYTADTMTIDCDREEFRIGKGTIWEGRNLYQLYQEAHTPWGWHAKLFAKATDLGIPMFSTPFDATSVDFLEQFYPPAYKIASFELTDHALLTKVAATGRPVIMSTGMASLGEIDESVAVLRDNGCVDLALLKCTSAYPAPPEEANLRRIPHMAKAFGVPAGLSDHTMGSAVPVAAVALGACIVEKHFTLSRDAPGPDSAFSMEPAEFKSMVEAVRAAEKALGEVTYELTEKEKASRNFRRSLFAVKDMRKGDPFTKENIRSIRPGHGLSPRFFDLIIGRKAQVDIPRGTPLDWGSVGEQE